MMDLGVPSINQAFKNIDKTDYILSHETGHATAAILGNIPITSAIMPNDLGVKSPGSIAFIGTGDVPAENWKENFERLKSWGESVAQVMMGNRNYSAVAESWSDMQAFFKSRKSNANWTIDQATQGDISEWRSQVQAGMDWLHENPSVVDAARQLKQQFKSNPVYVSTTAPSAQIQKLMGYGWNPSEEFIQQYQANTEEGATVRELMPAGMRNAMIGVAQAGVNALSMLPDSIREKYLSPVQESLRRYEENTGIISGSGEESYMMNPQQQYGLPNNLGASVSQYQQYVNQALNGYGGSIPPGVPFGGSNNGSPFNYLFTSPEMRQQAGLRDYGQTNFIVNKAQSFLRGGMSDETNSDVLQRESYPALTEAAKKVNDVFKELSSTMSEATKNTTDFGKVVQIVSQAAQDGSSAARTAIQGLVDVGIDPVKAMSGQGVSPIGQYTPGAGMANFGGGRIPPGEEGGGEGEGGGPPPKKMRGFGEVIGEVAQKAAQSYYAIRGPYREFVEPIMQDMAAYGRGATAQYQQLAGYGVQGPMVGATAQYANMVANQQANAAGVGRAATMAWSGVLGGANGQNELANYAGGVLAPSLGVGFAAMMATGNPLVGLGVGVAAAGIGTASYGANALQDPYTAGRMYAAAQANGGMYTAGGFGAAFNQNPIAAISAGFQNGGIQNVNIGFTATGQGTGASAYLNPAQLTPEQMRQQQYGNIVSGFMNQNLGQVQTPLGGFGPPNQGPLNGVQIAIGANMLAANQDVFNPSGLDDASRRSIANQVVTAYGLQGTVGGQGMMGRQNIIAANMAMAQAGGVDVNKLLNLYTTSAGGSQVSTIGTAAYGGALDAASAWAASNPQAAGVMGQFAPQIASGQNAAIMQGMAPTDIFRYQELSDAAARGGPEAQRLFQRQVTRDQLAPGLKRQLEISGYGVTGTVAANTTYALLDDNGYGDQSAQAQAAQSMLTYGIGGQRQTIAGGALIERGFNIQSIMGNRLLGRGMNAASTGAVNIAGQALTDFNGMTNAQATVQAQAEAQAAQMNYGYGAYGNMNVQNFNRLTAGFAQAPADAARFGALISGNAIAWSQQVDQGSAAQWMRTVQTGSQGGTVGMGAGYNENISAAQASEVASRGTAQGFIRGDGRYSVAQISGMNQIQRQVASRGLEIEQRDFEFGMESRQLARSQAATLTERGFEDRGVALGRSQQDWSRYVQGQQIGLQGQQMQYNYQYQSTQMGIDRSHQIAQQQWGTEDLAYQRNMNELQYGFSMIDASENVRYSRGRERRVAMRHQEEATVTFSMQESQQTKEEQRNRERIKWADDQYNRDRQHFEQSYQFEQRNFKLTEENYHKEGEFIMQQRQLEDEQRSYKRQIEDLDMADARTRLKFEQDIKKSMDDLNGAGVIWNQIAAEAAAKLKYMAETGSLLAQVPVRDMSVLNQTQARVTSQTYQQAISYTPQVTGAGSAGVPLAVTRHVGGAGYDLGGPVAYGLPSFDEGGFTGMGSKHEVKGVVHGGEWVVPQGGSLVSSNPEMLILLKKIHDELQGIHKDGGNAMVNIIQGTPTKAVNSAKSLYQKAWAQ